MNIVSKDILHPCTSCGGCAAVCPANAIVMVLNEQGFYRPVLDVDKCVDCSLCTKVCYKYDDVKPYNIAEHKEILMLACQARDNATLNTTTSGGIAYLLAKALYRQGYKCIGVVYDTLDDSAKHVCAADEKDIEFFKGSKYIQSMTYPTFKRMLDKEEKREKTVLFGTPCQIYAVDKFLKRINRRNDFLLVDIYCHGCPSLKIWHKYVQEIKKLIKKPRFDHVNFRSKIKGWGNFVVEVIVDDLQVFISDRKKDEFYQLFFSNLMLNEACHDCALRSTLEYTDIRLGDFWGKCYDTDIKGVSGVTLVTERGKQAFDFIRKETTVKEHDWTDFLPYQSWNVDYQIDKKIRNHLFAMLPDKSLKEIQDYYFAHQSFSQFIKRYIKKIIFLFSPRFINRVKKMYHQIHVF